MGTGQRPPPGDWIWWVNQGGRGSGKSTPCMLAFADDAHELGADFVGVVLCENDEEARKLIEDPKSGLRAILPPWKRPAFNPSIGGGLLTFPSGAVAHVISAEKPSKGRSPNFNRWLIDDPPKFGAKSKDLFDALARAFRLQGHGLRAYIATTPPGDPPPRCPELLEYLLEAQFHPEQRDWTYSIAPSDANMSNLDRDTRRVLATFAGGAYEAAERKGVYDKAGGPRVFRGIEFAQSPIRVERLPCRLQRVAVWIDPNVSSATNACEVGIVAVGELQDGRGVVLEDASGHFGAVTKPAEGMTSWTDVAIDLLERWEHHAPGHFGVETNRGEAQAEALLSMAVDLRRQRALAEQRAPRPLVRIITVHSNRTKAERADLLVSYYRAGNVHHLPGLDAVEGQFRNLSPARRQGPGYDRADAAVYGLLDMFRLLDKVRPGALGMPQHGPLAPAGGTLADGIHVGGADRSGPTFAGFSPPGMTAHSPGVYGRSSF